MLMLVVGRARSKSSPSIRTQFPRVAYFGSSRYAFEWGHNQWQDSFGGRDTRSPPFLG